MIEKIQLSLISGYFELQNDLGKEFLNGIEPYYMYCTKANGESMFSVMFIWANVET